MTGKTESGDYFFDPEVIVMTLSTGICSGLVLIIMSIIAARELMPVLFVIVLAGMVFMEGSWLNFWYRPSMKGKEKFMQA